jgi:hypothetical protein
MRGGARQDQDSNTGGQTRGRVLRSSQDSDSASVYACRLSCLASVLLSSLVVVLDKKNVMTNFLHTAFMKALEAFLLLHSNCVARQAAVLACLLVISMLAIFGVASSCSRTMIGSSTSLSLTCLTGYV